MHRLAHALPALLEETWTSAGRDVFCCLSAPMVVVHRVAYELPSETRTHADNCGPICQELSLRRARTTALQKSDVRDTVGLSPQTCQLECFQSCAVVDDEDGDDVVDDDDDDGDDHGLHIGCNITICCCACVS